MLSIQSSVRRARLPIGSLVILLALIGWGFQYKTSLYYHLFHTSPEPPAKLLSDAERPQTARSKVAGYKLKTESRAANPHQLAAVTAGHEPAREAGFVSLVTLIVISPLGRRRARFSIRPPPLS